MFDQELNQKNGFTDVLFVAMGLGIRLLLALTTAAFFAEYVSDVFAWFMPPEWAKYAAAFSGVFLLDVSAAGWSHFGTNHSNTLEQQRFAVTASWLDLGMSLLVTAVFVGLTTPLLATALPPDLYQAMIVFVSWMGVFVGIVAFAGNAFLLHEYVQNSSEKIQQRRNNELHAAALRGQHELETERLKTWIARSQANIRKEMPGYTARAANQTASEYLANMFSQLDKDGDGVISEAEIAAALNEADVMPPLPVGQPVRTANGHGAARPTSGQR